MTARLLLSVWFVIGVMPTAAMAAPPNVIVILADDPGEKRNLAKTDRAKATQLREQLHTWSTSVNGLMPQPNPDWAAKARK